MRRIPLVSDLTCCISLPDNFVFRLEESAHLSAADFLFIENLDWPLANAICYCHYASFFTRPQVALADIASFLRRQRSFLIYSYFISLKQVLCYFYFYKLFLNGCF